MSYIDKTIDGITGSRWRRFMALVALGLMIGQTAQEGVATAIPSDFILGQFWATTTEKGQEEML